MSITVELTDIKIIKWVVDMDAETVHVTFEYRDSVNKTWAQGLAIFWREFPELGVDENDEPIPQPDYWFLIPINFVVELNDFNTAIDTALTTKFLT